MLALLLSLSQALRRALTSCLSPPWPPVQSRCRCPSGGGSAASAHGSDGTRVPSDQENSPPKKEEKRSYGYGHRGLQPVLLGTPRSTDAFVSYGVPELRNCRSLDRREGPRAPASRSQNTGSPISVDQAWTNGCFCLIAAFYTVALCGLRSESFFIKRTLLKRYQPVPCFDYRIACSLRPYSCVWFWPVC